MTTPFVGREAELAALTADLDAAVAGHGGVVLLAGEPGIGKTRLAEELAVQARARGALVLWGRCWEGEGAPAFWPWVQVVRGYVRAGDPTGLRRDMGAGAADIAQVVPAVRDCLPHLPNPPAVEPAAARFRLFDSLAGFLRAAAARRPLVLVLDDLHWADASSLALLRFVSHEVDQVGLLVLGSYRHTEVDREHPLLGTLADLTRGQHRRRLLLGGLDQQDVASFVELVAGVAPSAELVAAVHKQTDGNPFFVGEALQAVYAADPGPHLAELAHHFMAAAPASQEMVARAVRAATLAGRRALEVLAWEDAADLFERALAALALAERPDQHERCELLLAVGEARMAASDVGAARAAYQRAGELARRIGSPQALARAGLGLGLEFTYGIVDQVEVGLLEGALVALGGADSPLRARVLARPGQGAAVHPAGPAAPGVERGGGRAGRAAE